MPTPIEQRRLSTALPAPEVDELSFSWQQQFARAVRDPRRLCQALELSDRFIPAALRVAEKFPLVVPHSFLARMRRGEPSDPLLRQVLPLADEEREFAGFSLDPVADQTAKSAPGLLHKYEGRVLLMASGTCAVHCRYCFRRHYPYHEEPRRRDDWDAALEAVAADPSIHEVILSGGDPLSASDERLGELLDRIAAIPHVSRLRIHTRLPIVIPARVTDGFLERLDSIRPQVVVVVHANHANELVGDCRDGLARLVRSGVPTLNQAVLLAGVNDSVEALTQLSESLVDLGVFPYYLHQLDRVVGAAHFEVPQAAGRRLVRELRKRLPGYAVPRYVQEIPGEQSKTPLMEP